MGRGGAVPATGSRSSGGCSRRLVRVRVGVRVRVQVGVRVRVRVR
jgi:hypothetical protein